MDPRIRRSPSFADFPRTALTGSIPARFADQVARHGARLAVQSHAIALTYQELDWASSRVAELVLGALGARPHRVALLLGQGVPLVAAILGVLKAGHAYVALDPTHPRARLEGVLAHARPGLCLTDGEHAALAAGLAELSGLGGRALEVETAAVPRPAPDPGVRVSPDAAASLYYTSGSTGAPKGVLDTHRNVLHNVMRYTNSLGIGADDRLTLLQGPAFSGAASSLFGALLNGAAVFPFDVPRDGADRIGDWLAARRITMYHSVPALFRRVVAAGRALPDVRVVRLEGDLTSPRDVELFRAAFDPGSVLVNGLGATECGLVRQYVIDHATAAVGSTVPIGYPVEDMDVLLLGPAGQPVGAGEAGEIVVRSEYLAVGYWDRSDLTRAAFRTDPDGSGRRLYRTGDVGRMSADGCLEHLGRRDQQVKVRGERIDVEAIQAALLETGVVREAVVAAHHDGDGDARLVAYLVPTRPPGPTTSALRRLLMGRLPGHPLPARFLLVDALPLDPNGKVDRRTLPAPDRARPRLDTPLEPPRTAREAALATMWTEVLGFAPVGVEDDFFELGGDSLLAVEILTRVAHAWGVEVAVTDFAERPTVAALAALLDGVPEPASAAPVAGASPLFFLHSDYTGSGAECITLARHLGPGLRLVALAPSDVADGRVPPSIETMAVAHLRRLRAVQPRGPYRLAGHCSAGVVAFEMARQLHRLGETIEALVLIEPPPLRAVRARDGRLRALGPGVSGRAWRRIHGLATRARAAAAAGDLRGTVWRVLRTRWSRPGHAHAATTGARWVGRVYADAVARYAPGQYGGLVTCLRTRASQAAGEFEVGSWREAVDRLRVEIVPGDHESCLTAEARTLAARLRACIEAPPSTGP